ncbi:MAG: GGDEF domain-containing protein, partial [Desulfofustis sp.]
MFQFFANSMVIVGACILSISLLPVRKLVAELPAGQMRRCWIELAVLIVVLIIGYISYMLANWERHTSWLDFIVPSVFLFVSVFVWLTTSLSQQTAFDVRRVTMLERESITDALTGLYNRRYLDRRLEEEIGRARRYGMPMSVLLIDIDYFKQINDTCGHAVGDALLKDLGALFLNTIRDSDVAARYGGDELMIFALNTNENSAFFLAERLRGLVEAHRLNLLGKSNQEAEIKVTISIGIAGFSQEVPDARSLVQRADEALYR